MDVSIVGVKVSGIKKNEPLADETLNITRESRLKSTVSMEVEDHEI